MRRRHWATIAIGLPIAFWFGMRAVDTSSPEYLAGAVAVLAVVGLHGLSLRCPGCRAFLLYKPIVGRWGYWSPVFPKGCLRCGLSAKGRSHGTDS